MATSMSAGPVALKMYPAKLNTSPATTATLIAKTFESAHGTLLPGVDDDRSAAWHANSLHRANEINPPTSGGADRYPLPLRF
jgi:hypothetical protein